MPGRDEQRLDVAPRAQDGADDAAVEPERRVVARLRARFGSVRSILMDRETLLAHPRQWVTEPNPTDRSLTNLTGPEEALYQDLIEDRYGPAVRLEQERVRFSLVRRALGPWTG